MGTQGPTPTQLDEEGLCGGSSAHGEGHPGTPSDALPEGPTVELESMDRQTLGAPAEESGAAGRGVGGDQQTAHLSPGELVEDLPLTAHDAAGRQGPRQGPQQPRLESSQEPLPQITGQRGSAQGAAGDRGSLGQLV
jgi:hypothetical protein